MGETGIVRFPGSLDPGAEEFRPGNHPAATLFRPTQVYYPYSCPYAPSGSGVPFSDGLAVGVPYPHFSTPAVYVSPPAPTVVAAPPVPPSSSPTRSLLLSAVASEFVSESMVRRELEVFGDVRGVQMERLRDGMVTVHFYDLRHAEMALTAIRNQHMQQQTRLCNHYASLVKSRISFSEAEFYAAAPLPPPARGLIAGRPVWAQYIVPPYNALPDGHNQGTIVIFNLDSEVSAQSLREIFEPFGPIKELRETPSKKNQRFVEFFDIRDAAKALKEMNGKEIHGKAVIIEFSRPGGHSRKFFNAAISKNNNVHHTKSMNLPPPLQPPSMSPPSPPPLPRKYPRSPRPHFPQNPLSSNKSMVKKGRFNVNTSVNEGANSSGSIETTMGSMNLGGAVGNGVEDKYSNGPQSRNFIKHHSSSRPQPARNRNWKGKLKHAKKLETRFLIKEDAIVESSSRDPRTTVMIKNIPNKYSQKLLLNMLDNHCIHCNEQIAEGDDQPLSSYDFVYLPIDFNNKCNVGYGFVNLTSPEATLRFYKAFHLQHWEVFNSRKICEVTYARVQGLEALKEHFKNSKFPCEMEHYLPVVFSPPRDGRQLTEPLPIVGQKQQNNEMDGDDDGDQNDMPSSCSSQNGVVGDDDQDKHGQRFDSRLYQASLSNERNCTED
ncbi:hypothetical protein L6164_012433 [Bauhinia variegata]|uniref:Uncharacterized protein n=1 Tax=Bauhinia variegata TaxID=167791 RepID=A0ACB9P928_BAUVA|nr:hypothetical protein L6164_012433 [Bauhinia variegata]